jgi:hypothetical protein
MSSKSRGSFPGLKRLRREAKHSAPSTAKAKNAWRYKPMHHTPSERGAGLNTGGINNYYNIKIQADTGVT